MSLIALLEESKAVAMQTREERAALNAAEIAEFEEYGADLAAVLDAEELASAEEALRLAEELDEREEEQTSEREKADVELARLLLEAEEETVAACSKDEVLARAVEAQLQKEMTRVAKLERRERTLADKKLCANDLVMAEQLAAEIVEEERKLRALEAADRRLASRLVKGEQNVLKQLPQTEEALKGLSSKINGDAPVPLRSRLRGKLVSLRKSMANMMVDANKENAGKV